MALNGSIELSQLVEVSSEAVDGWFRQDPRPQGRQLGRGA